jgi:hypothetical protein
MNLPGSTSWHKRGPGLRTFDQDRLAAAEVDVDGYVNLFRLEGEQFGWHLEGFDALSVRRDEVQDWRVGFVRGMKQRVDFSSLVE